MTEKRNGAASAGTDDTLRTHEPISILPQPCVKRKPLKVSRSEAVKIGKTFAPSFDLPLLSKCLKPHKYGIEPIEPIRSQIFSESRRSDFRKLNHKLTIRCNDVDYARLQMAKKAFGADCTVQEFGLTAFRNEFTRIESKRRVADNGITLYGS